MADGKKQENQAVAKAFNDQTNLHDKIDVSRIERHTPLKEVVGK